MHQLASFVVGRRRAIYAVALVLTVACALLVPQVNINEDMTRYLPLDSQVRQGYDAMDADFEDTTPLRVMYEGLSDEGAQEVADDLAALAYVTGVEVEQGTEEGGNAGKTLFTLQLEGDKYSSTAADAVAEVRAYTAGSGAAVAGDALDASDTMSGLGSTFLLCMLILVPILLVMSASWLEPVAFLLTIGVAVVLNMGTNAVFESVSSMTFSIAAVLQLALSMDYSIMLMDRYRQVRARMDDAAAAMVEALEQGFAAIASSSVTTVAGMVCLVFMSFTIGRDMGLVLAKGVALSLVCVLALLPGLVVSMDPLIQRTQKRTPRPKLRRWSGASARGRYVLLAVFAAVAVVGFAGKGAAGISFFMDTSNADTAVIDEAFAPSQQLVIVYDAQGDEARLAAALELVAELPDVESVQSWETTLAKELTASDMQEAAGLGEAACALVYYARYGDGDTGELTVQEFVDFLKAEVAEGGALEGFMSDTDAAKLGMLVRFAGTEEALGAQEMGELLGGMSDKLTAEDVEAVYLLHAALDGADPSWTMTLEEFVDTAAKEVEEGGALAAMAGDDAAAQVAEAKDLLAEARDQLVGTSVKRAVVTTPLARDDEGTTQLIEDVERYMSTSGTTFYLVGDAAMAHEMSLTFGSELNFITLLTALVIFAIVAVTFRSLAVPAVLVLLIQTAINLTMGLGALQGEATFYVALLLVQALLMGATIDYAILFTSYYRELRRTCGVREALEGSFAGSVGTILTSGSILVLVTLVVGLTNADVTTAAVCLTISKGSFVAVLLVLALLPGTLAALDRFVAGPGRLRAGA